MRDRPGYRRTACPERILTQKPPNRRSLRLFQQRKPTETKEWQQKLPDFVLRLEEAVYRGARSKVRDVRFPFARRFFHDEKRRLGFKPVVSPVPLIGRAFPRDFANAKKSRVCDCRAEPPPEAHATRRSRDTNRRTALPSACTDYARHRRRIRAWIPGSSRERDADEPSFRVSSTHLPKRNPPRDARVIVVCSARTSRLPHLQRERDPTMRSRVLKY